MSDNPDLDIAIEQTFKAVWPDGDASIRGYLAPIIADFAQSNCCDGHYFEEFQSGDLSKLAARIWEAMLFVRFRELGMAISSTGQGPDFLLDGRIYVEAVTPQPGDPEKGGLPKEWLERREEQACKVPFEEMLLRWTSVLRTKKDKHLKDIEAERADPSLPLVIAVNSCRLGSDTHGIAGVPLAAMAVLSFGDPTAQVDVETGSTIGKWYLAWQGDVLKYNGEPIPTDSFLKEEYSCVSALIGCSGFYVAEDDRAKFCNQPPYYIVHNPMAKKPLTQPWIPGAIEYVAKETSPGTLELIQLTA
jgi:hypothetical protein